jgi:hypothetical protein
LAALLIIRLTLTSATTMGASAMVHDLRRDSIAGPKNGFAPRFIE